MGADAGSTAGDVVLGRVLAVDDDPATRVLYEHILGRAGVDCVSVASGPEALERLGTEAFAVVLLDSRMPGMSGLEVLETLRGAPDTRTLPVILVTGNTELDDRVRGLDLGANDYVTKPFQAEELLARVRAQFRVRHAWDEVVEPLRRRMATVESLASVPFDASAEQLAAEFCRQMVADTGAESAFLLLFEDSRAAVPAAAIGPIEQVFKTGTAISEELASLCYGWGKRGPAIIDDARLLWANEPRRDLVAVGRAAREVFVLAPITRGRELTGVMGAVVSDVNGTVNRADHLSTLMDYAMLAGPLLSHRADDYAGLTRRRVELEQMIASRALQMNYQPIVELDTRTIVGFEALTRWDNGSPAAAPFADARTLGLGSECERMAIESALESETLLPAETWLSVNVSPTTVLDGDLGDLFHGLSRPVVLELTEHDIVHDYDQLVASLAPLNAQIAVDDAGTGTASLQHILALRPDMVKLDLGWVRGIEHDRVRQAMIRGLSHYTMTTDTKLLAEGIETEDEYEMLITLGVDLGQGYLFGRPVPLPFEPVAA